MKKVEQTLTSLEVAEMVGKTHRHLMRDIRTYVTQFNQSKIGLVDFFQESTYKDSKGEERPCYNITKKGCEFIAHKLTGVKGTAFTARYINRFHEMEEIILSGEPSAPTQKLYKGVPVVTLTYISVFFYGKKWLTLSCTQYILNVYTIKGAGNEYTA